MNDLDLIGRTRNLFQSDLEKFDKKISEIVQANKFLVIGGGGSIGQAVTKELFRRKAKLLHVVDISENYLAELVRDLRSSIGYETKQFDTFALDCGDSYFYEFMAKHNYDFVLNLSAMKHVRSENCPFSMLRMLRNNVFNAIDTLNYSKSLSVKKYFCVSTDKAANPVNFMGASKRAMEICLMRKNGDIAVSGARFANVAFSNGSLLESFSNRIRKKQPLSLPSDIRRYFITEREAGVICLFSTILGASNEIYFPFANKEVHLTDFKLIATKLLETYGLSPVFCDEEQEARQLLHELDVTKFWPVNCFKSDTVGEKTFEEFHTQSEIVLETDYEELRVVQKFEDITESQINEFRSNVENINLRDNNARGEFILLLKNFVPTFEHKGGDKFLNSRM